MPFSAPSRALLIAWTLGNLLLVLGHTRLGAATGLRGLGFTDLASLATWALGAAGVLLVAWRVRHRSARELREAAARCALALVEPRPRLAARARLGRLLLGGGLYLLAWCCWGALRPVAWALLLTATLTCKAPVFCLLGLSWRVRPRITLRASAIGIALLLLAEAVNAFAFTFPKLQEGTLFTPDPVTGFANRPGHRGAGITIDAAGFRASSADVASVESARFTLLLLGGSTAFGWGLQDADTLAPLLEVELARRGFPRPLVLNAATASWYSWNEALYFREKAPAFRLDAAVFLHGRNDLYWGWMAELEPEQRQGFLAHRLLTGSHPGRTQLLCEQSLSNHWLGGHLFPRAERPAVDLEAQGRAVAGVYTANMTQVAALAEVRRLPTLDLLQPMLYFQRELLPLERASLDTGVGWSKGYWRGLDALRSAQERVALNDYYARGALLGALDRESCSGLAYIDECHYSPAANRVLAAGMARELAAFLVRPSGTRPAISLRPE